MDFLTVSVKVAQTFEATTIRGKGVPLSHLIKKRSNLLTGVIECLKLNVHTGNIKGGSITVLLTSCLTGLESAV